MKKIPVIMDVDTGIDDAFAICLVVALDFLRVATDFSDVIWIATG